MVYNIYVVPMQNFISYLSHINILLVKLSAIKYNECVIVKSDCNYKNFLRAYRDNLTMDHRPFLQNMNTGSYRVRSCTERNVHKDFWDIRQCPCIPHRDYRRILEDIRIYARLVSLCIVHPFRRHPRIRIRWYQNTK